VICTHNHLDHLGPDTVSQIQDGQFFLTTQEGKNHLEQLGKTKVKALRLGESVTVGDCKLTAVFASHTVEAFGIVVEAEGKTLYFSGDTLYDERLFDVVDYHPDIAFVCINGRLGNMNVSEALHVAKKISAKINIPNHYDMFASNSEDPHLFADHISGGRILEFNVPYTF
jgi:L-ascorbate metabolism protein UlaG (beta-lactamase superfamily)